MTSVISSLKNCVILWMYHPPSGNNALETAFKEHGLSGKLLCYPLPDMPPGDFPRDSPKRVDEGEITLEIYAPEKFGFENLSFIESFGMPIRHTCNSNVLHVPVKIVDPDSYQPEILVEYFKEEWQVI